MAILYLLYFILCILVSCQVISGLCQESMVCFEQMSEKFPDCYMGKSISPKLGELLLLTRGESPGSLGAVRQI
jgi:hypothetical protein